MLFRSPREVAARPLTAHVARMVGLNVVAADGALRAFRPSAVTVSLERPAGSARLAWSGPLTHLAPHGDAVRVQVTSAGRELIADVTPQAVADLALAPGREVWLTVKATAVETYDDPGPPG